MTENTEYILLWMLLVASLGFLIGWTLGDAVRRWKNAEERVTICVISCSTPELSPWTAGSDRCTAP